MDSIEDHIGGTRSTDISRLGPAHVLRLTCACGHTVEWSRAELYDRGLSPSTVLETVQSRARCARCGVRGAGTLRVMRRV